MKLSRILVILMVVVVLLAVTAGPVPAQEAETLPLAEHGPFGVGWQLITFVDESREGETLQTMIWYPAIIPEGQEEDARIFGLFGAAPDTSAAPYPLILSSHGFPGTNMDLAYLTGHLASYGFVVIGMTHPRDSKTSRPIDRSLDTLFVLDQAALGIEGLTDVIDPDVVGVMGFSYGAYTALSVSGARIDAEYMFSWYEENQDKVINEFRDTFIDAWDDVVAYRAQFEPPLIEGEMWPPFADERIRAVMPIAPCFGDVFGDRGLTTATIPALLMAGTGDKDCSYDRAVYVYDTLGTDDRYLLSFPDWHAFPLMSPYQAPIKHFATAFFGTYLQGREDYADYLTTDFVDQVENVTWGPVDTEAN